MRWWGVCVAGVLTACGQAPTFVDVEVVLGEGAPAPSTLSVRLFDKQRMRLQVATKSAALPRRLHIDAGVFDDGGHVLRVVIAGGPNPIMGFAQVRVEPGATSEARIVLSGNVADSDGDGVPDAIDNCPGDANA